MIFHFYSVILIVHLDGRTSVRTSEIKLNKNLVSTTAVDVKMPLPDQITLLSPHLEYCYKILSLGGGGVWGSICGKD